MSQETKSVIRKRVLNLLRNQKEEDRLRKSLVILERLFAIPEFQNSKIILFYASFDGEVETFEMMKQTQRFGKKIALPAIDLNKKEIIPALVAKPEKDLEDGPYGIKQPKYNEINPLDLEEIDMCIVPGVAFDKKNHRLGRGEGFYDRFLKTLPRGTPSVGLAFDFQVVDCLPHQTHDIPVSQVITN